MRTFAMILSVSAIMNAGVAHARLGSSNMNGETSRVLRSYVLVNKDTGRSCLLKSELASGSQRMVIETNLTAADAERAGEIELTASQTKSLAKCEGAELQQGLQLVAGLQGEKTAGAPLIALGVAAYWGLCTVANFAMLGEAIGSMFGSRKRGPGTIISETVCLPATIANVGIVIAVSTVADYLPAKSSPPEPTAAPDDDKKQ